MEGAAAANRLVIDALSDAGALTLKPGLAVVVGVSGVGAE
jgi:hypothetical protein